MLTIRDSQFQTLGRSLLISRLVQHVSTYFPGPVAAIGRPTLMQILHRLTIYAESWPLSEEALVKLASLAILYGDDFITQGESTFLSPESAWMAAYLTDSDVDDPNDRVRRLFLAVMEHHSKAAASALAWEAFRAG